MQAVFVITRHQGAVDWLVQEGYIKEGEFEIVPHITSSLMSILAPGDVLIGVIPMDFAAQACEKGVRVFVIALPKMTKEMRGKELSADDMRAAGAHIREYRIKRSHPLTPTAMREILG